MTRMLRDRECKESTNSRPKKDNGKTKTKAKTKTMIKAEMTRKLKARDCKESMTVNILSK